ncbi:MAG: hypothetical protein LUI60_07405 [Clostridia bacterium]|nr:hypothetical protein [Clostridia bacterium]
MKKFLKIIALAVLAMLAVAVLTFTACDNSTKYVDAYCFTDGTMLRLDVTKEKSYTGGDETNFTTSNSLEEVKAEIDAMTLTDGTLKTEVYGSTYILIEYTTSDSVLHYFLVISNGSGNYDFISPWDKIGDVTVLVPFHLLGDGFEQSIAENGRYSEIAEGEPYYTNYGIEDFYNFYCSEQEYTVVIENDTIKVRKNSETSRVVTTFITSENGQTGVVYSVE